MKKTALSRPERKLPRDQFTGRFELSGPLNDPSTFHQAVRWVRAIDEILPLLQSLGDSPDERLRAAAAVSLLLLGSFRSPMLEALSVDKVALRDATKPRLRSVRFTPGGAT